MVPNGAWADMSLHQHARRGGGTKHAKFCANGAPKVGQADPCHDAGFLWHSMADEHVNLAYTSHRSQITTCSVRCWGALWEFSVEHHGQPRLAIGTAAPGLPAGEASCACYGVVRRPCTTLINVLAHADARTSWQSETTKGGLLFFVRIATTQSPVLRRCCAHVDSPSASRTTLVLTAYCRECLPSLTKQPGADQLVHSSERNES